MSVQFGQFPNDEESHRHRRRARRKRYGIEYRVTGRLGRRWGWSLKGRYRTVKQRDRALADLIKKRESWVEYRAQRDLP